VGESGQVSVSSGTESSYKLNEQQSVMPSVGESD